MASLLDSGRVKIQQHQQERHAAETASNSKGTNDTMSPVGSLQTILNCGTYLMQLNTVLKSFSFAQTCTTGQNYYLQSRLVFVFKVTYTMSTLTRAEDG